MTKVNVVIREVLEKVVEVEAENEDLAMEIVKDRYDKEEPKYILYSNDWKETEIFCL